ncbi:exodeoxyribonuclease VII small subunit [Pseudohongiella spirulinae]|uniref:Exodeoxyribonuclease 7 small subunit n=1 Tax=Pseudohongiella spirulinae TaxID=1249552 RepID=A0A0S2KAR0_9GAMM|nr:exodeoxyribonuclease VII small subunit [Pseudohongiella spirulinae]ALO45414.1 exodeoxyribonuclease VII small subunit [Pseudohongiella spirulinae]
MAQDKAPDFEETLTELEALVSRMEEGQMGLEESLAAFEKGINLTRECQQALQQAELKVQILTNADSEPPQTDVLLTTPGNL